MSCLVDRGGAREQGGLADAKAQYPAFDPAAARVSDRQLSRHAVPIGHVRHASLASRANRGQDL